MNARKKILILGMGHSQVDLAVAARQYGATVHACAEDGAGPAMKYVDYHTAIDILDIRKIVNYSRENDIDVIFTIGLETAIRPVVLASEELGLPCFITGEDIAKIENKAVWREILGNMPGNLRFMTGGAPEEFLSWLDYPAILKPVDGSGQRGVFTVANYEELKEKFRMSKKFSSTKTVMLEELAEGEEISVNAFMLDGELEFAAISDRISYVDLPGGIIKEHYIPSKYAYSSTAEKILDIVQYVNNSMNFTQGHIYFQMKIMNSSVALIEFTPRFDGCHLWKLIKASYGLDLLQVSLEYLFEGRSPTLKNFVPFEPSKKRVLGFVSDKPGIIVHYDNYPMKTVNPDLYWYYEDGEVVRKVTGIMEKVGYYIV